MATMSSASPARVGSTGAVGGAGIASPASTREGRPVPVGSMARSNFSCDAEASIAIFESQPRFGIQPRRSGRCDDSAVFWRPWRSRSS